MSGLFTEEFEEELTDTPPKNENEILIYRGIQTNLRKTLIKILMNLYVEQLLELSKSSLQFNEN